MKRSDLEHVIQAAGAIADDNEIVVVGNQSVLGQFPEAPAELLRSVEADIYHHHRPELADLIDGTIGEGSPFHHTFGYYGQGVGVQTAVLPAGWKDRVIRVLNANTVGISGLCLDVHDLAISKYVAVRDKDRAFTRTLARCGIIRRADLLGRLADTVVRAEMFGLVAARIDADFNA
jgi:hypothetical protein